MEWSPMRPMRRWVSIFKWNLLGLGHSGAILAIGIYIQILCIAKIGRRSLFTYFVSFYQSSSMRFQWILIPFIKIVFPFDESKVWNRLHFFWMEKRDKAFFFYMKSLSKFPIKIKKKTKSAFILGTYSWMPIKRRRKKSRIQIKKINRNLLKSSEITE